VAWPLLRRAGLPATLFVPTAYPDVPGRAFWWDRLHDALRTTRAPAVATPAGRLPLGDDGERSTAFRALRSSVKGLPHDEAMGAVERVLDDLEAPPAVSPVLGWDRLRALAAEGLAVAPHSRTHPVLTKVTPEALVDEVRGSLDDLERELGPTPPVFAYPTGGVDDAVVGTLAAAGYRLGFTTSRGNEAVAGRGGAPDWLRLRRVNVGRRTTPGLLAAQLLPVPLPPRRRRAPVPARTS
jgi:peptidoglycan/xylan/chitin deacetylase (PgdA/CDA1 family)